MRRPFDQAHRIPFGLQQCRQIPLQARIRHRCLLPPTPGLADPPLRSDSFSREFFDPSRDRLPIRARARCYLTDTTRADLERFCSQIQAPLLLIQFVPQDLVLLLCRHSLTIPYFPVFWKLFADEPLVPLPVKSSREESHIPFPWNTTWASPCSGHSNAGPMESGEDSGRERSPSEKWLRLFLWRMRL